MKSYETEINKVLSNPENRKNLVEYFKLNDPENKSSLVRAMSMESGFSEYSDMFPVAGVMLNRALSQNLVQSASNFKVYGDKGLKLTPRNIDQVIKEAGEFAINKKEYNNRKPELELFIKSGKAVNQRDYSKNLEVAEDLFAGKNTFDFKGKTVNISPLYYFSKGKGSYPQINLKTENGHHFSTHFDLKRFPFSTHSPAKVGNRLG